ncbi:Polyadenylate-binding protein-interacting protein 6 [Raphanus sativus]|uniref:Polyadenylate-binding protein-interacting protein 6 n=1 Tax=Raphanus sativus TaxID=3726 RepID=A0A6J0L0G9_RAPSA|nr:polyadenylate-binding protein-interacting protein 6 [Raphanus sativus]XP_056867271.1 polyadenylate-binding protein-interacting protein 6-like [Raphanus sativus]KAJ4877601.1 Polyadenylate-binding protein-interacting protein 6 [Raphanus sativus]KAJ4894521.1 Polyadenylate-binding protein-interacting protein 6 [Raphanus sativus]
MKPGVGSGLNPNAAAYVPLSKREGDSAKPVAAATHHVHHQPYGYGGVQGKGGAYIRDDDDDSEMEMEFLLTSFSGLSDESIRDVYLANNGDLDATIEMLTQLEIFSNEAEEYLPLPDTLGIADVPDETIVPSTSSAPPKQKSASNEASGSSSSTSSGTTPNNAPVSSSSS